ncbi:MAG: phosphotransferase, partial [Oscillospiraceae bacterium]|nr:phosphotransferase [Oscillospiraceae bacterium]
LAATGHLARMGVRTLQFLSGENGPIYCSEDGERYRLSRYAGRCSVRDSVSSRSAQDVGAAFGALHMALSSLPVNQLTDMRGGHFHSLPRYRDALLAVAHRAEGEQQQLCRDILAAMQQQTDTQPQQLPERVLHGDPKLHNLLFSDSTDLPFCFIDFDNAGVGYLPDDFGDAARSACCINGSEFSTEHFTRFARGFLSAAPFLSDAERRALPAAPARVALELAARYLTDALSGEQYFGALTTEQKLLFAAQRFALYKDALQKLPQLEAACGF